MTCDSDAPGRDCESASSLGIGTRFGTVLGISLELPLMDTLGEGVCLGRGLRRGAVASEGLSGSVRGSM